MKSIQVKGIILMLTLAAGTAGCEGDVSAPSSGGAADETAALDATQAADLAQAESSGQVSSQGRVLTEAEGAALFAQTQQASAAKTVSGREVTADGLELTTAAVTGRAVIPTNVMLETHSGQFAAASIWYYFAQWGGWLHKSCVALPKPGTWKSFAFTVPNDVEVFFNGYRPGTKCTPVGPGSEGNPDLQVQFHSPANPTLKNWWVQVF